MSIIEPHAKVARRIPRSIHRKIIGLVDRVPFGGVEILRVYNGALKMIGGPYRSHLPCGARIDCDPQDLIQQYILHFGVWEPAVTSLITRILQPGDVFVDIGANIGYDSLLAANLVGDNGRVLAFEASPTIFQSLAYNITLNANDNIIACNVAVSDREQRLQLYSGPAENLGRTTTVAARGLPRQCEVQAYSLMRLLSGEDTSRIRLIKIDIEGGEIPVVDDFLTNLSSYPETTSLMVEVNPSPRWEATFEALFNAGFHAFAIPNQYDLGWYIRKRNSANHPIPITTLKSTQMDVFFTREEQWISSIPHTSHS
ncbi:MAG: FkbM family methyltransferase [Mycolicibacterium sp.]|uniref:FkbM family methyltransferase n=1 Tax=Mycolicibacterium sp. TaxID=2320850 RepID=UPI003D0D397D